MFANLKNKLIEEVKASPSKFQQFANAAQAAVSSSSSTTTPNSSENTDSGTNENFFSITEEDTPQNSPYRIQKLPRGGRASTQSLNGVGAAGAIPRTRKLSNSSMASDVSFRLPSYDAPAMYHLQSDLDETGSEFDDSASTARLDIITKDQLYDAYKKSLDRYHKYRCRYTDLAKKYKELERDSSKARSVLVETQDKALRRISELREQCTLEQQAKAHLEEALRIEMDDMSCKMQAYQTKLKLLGENPDNVAAALERSLASDDDKLIDLEAPETKTVAPTNDSQPSPEQDEDVAKLRQLLAEAEEQLKKLTENNKEANNTIASLRKQEEENVLLLAHTKQAIHTELEHKESEVRKLQDTVKQLEVELDLSNGRETQAGDVKEQLKKLKNDKQEVEAKLIAANHALSTIKSENLQKTQQMTVQLKKIETQLEQKEKEVHQLQVNLKQQASDLEQTNNSETQVKDVKEQLKMLEAAKLEVEAKLITTEQVLNSLKNDQAKKEEQVMAQQKQLELALANKETEVQQLQEQLKQHDAGLEIKEQFSQLQSSMQESEVKILSTEEELNKLRLENTTREEQVASLERQLQSQQELKDNETRQLQEKLEQLEVELASSKSCGAKVKEISEHLIQLENSKQETESKLLATEEQLTNLRLEHTAKELQVASLEKQLHSQLEQKDNEVHRLQEKLKQLQTELESSHSLGAQAEDAKNELKQLQNCKKEAEAKLISTEEQLNSLRIENAAKEQQVASLEKQLQSKQKQKEIEARQLQQKVTQLETELEYSKSNESQAEDIKQQLNELEKSKQQAEAKLVASEWELNVLRLNHTAKEDELASVEQQLIALKTDSDQSLEDLRLHNNQLNEIVQRYQQNESKLDEVQGQLLEARERLTQQEQRVLETEKSLEAEREMVAVLNVEKSAAEEQSLKLQQELQTLNLQLVSSTNSEAEAIGALRLQMETLSGQLTAAQASTVAKEKELKASSNKLNKLKKQHEQLQAKHTDQGKSIEQLRVESAKMEELRNEKLELQQRVTVILAEITTMQAHLQDVQTAQTQLEREKRQLESHIEALQQQQQDNDVQGELSTARIEEMERENSKLAERNCLLEEQNNHLQKQQDELTKIQNKMQQVLDEHSKLQNAQEIMEHDHRTLQDKCDSYEKVSIVAKDELTCVQQAKDILESQAGILQLDLDQAQQQLSEVRDRQRELEQQLEEQAQRSSELEANNEQVDILQATVHNLRGQLDSLKETEQSMQQKLQASSASHAAQVETLEARFSAANGDVERLHEANVALQQEIETLKSSTQQRVDYEQLQIENEYLNTHAKQLESELSQAVGTHSEGADLREKLKSLQCELYVLQEQAEHHASQLSEKDTASTAAKAELAQLKTAFEEQALELTRQSEHASFVSEQSDSVQKELLHVQQQLQERQAELAKAQERCVNLEDQLSKQKDDQLQVPTPLPTDSEHLRSLNEQLHRELEDLKYKSNGEQTNLQQEIDELQANNKEMAERITELETLRAGIQAQQLLASLAPKNVQDPVPVDEKALLEAKLKDIMSEVQDVTNRNLFLEQKCENFLILEQSNERLKLQNAKLSRQLDETLVSMQHSDSVPANTEFEYLRNIMFQYLTGNTNNETLVKVISAVLKFSPQQAQVALEKEHQRRSLLNKLI